MAATGPVGPPLTDEQRAVANAVRDAAGGADEVYVVQDGAPIYVFGHLSDANAYREQFGSCTVSVAAVLDHAEARALIEKED